MSSTWFCRARKCVLGSFGIAMLLHGAVASAIVIDDGGAGYSSTGAFTQDSGGFDGNEHYQTDKAATGDTATYSFTGLATGSYFVNATWVPSGNRTTGATYTVSNGGGVLSVNQQTPHLITSDREGAGANRVVGWTNVVTSGAPVAEAGGTLTVTVADTDVNNYLMVDAVRLVAYNTSPGVYVVDDLIGVGNGFSTTGDWTLSDANGDENQYLDEELYQTAANNGATATWTFTGLPSGLYEVSSTWFAGVNRTSAANYSLSDSGGLAIIDQTSAPNDFTDLGQSWEILKNAVNVTDGTFTVTASHSVSSTFLMADAIRLELVPEPGSFAMLLLGSVMLWAVRRKRGTLNGER